MIRMIAAGWPSCKVQGACQLPERNSTIHFGIIQDCSSVPYYSMLFIYQFQKQALSTTAPCRLFKVNSLVPQIAQESEVVGRRIRS